MKIPFGTIHISKQSKALIKEALASERLASGRLVREFEERFAELVGTKEAVALSSGTDADTLALSVLYDFGAKRNDEVICPALSFVSTGGAILNAGFKPVFVDIELETLNINPEKIEAAITKKTRAIMPVHLMGKPAEMNRIIEIAKKHKLFVIGDAAEAHGATYKNKNVGAIGDMAAYSLYLAHIVSTIEGGVVTTERKDFAEILRSLRSHGRACKCAVCILNTNPSFCPQRFKDGRDIRFIFERIGYSAKMNELEAAVGLGNLKDFKRVFQKRRSNLLAMMRRIKEFNEYLFTFKEEKYEIIGPHAFPLIVRRNAPFTRDELSFFLEKNGIETRNLFSSMPTQCPGFSFLKYKKGQFPNAEFIGEHGLHIGVHQDIVASQIEYFFECLAKFLKRYR
jgi:dTDP-4-amino-4,6-dideoxygalactose transaminase